MAREFTAHVVLHVPGEGPTVFKIGDEVPEWANVGDHVTNQGTSRAVQTAEEAPAGDDTVDADESPADAFEEPADDDESPADDDGDDVAPYTEWTKAELKAEAKGREIVGFSKASHEELVTMLEDDDLNAEG